MLENPPLEAEYDLVIVGSGGGSMAAALVAKDLGKSVVILEKLDQVGGSTSFSGGVWWVPNNSLLKQAGIHDSFEKSREYFNSVVTYEGPGVTPERRDAFLKAAPRMMDYLIGKGMKVRRPTDDWPDYYDDRPGGLPEGRSVMPQAFDINTLGEWKNHLAIYPPMHGLPIGADEFTTLFTVKRTWAGKMRALKFARKMMVNKLLGRSWATNGGAIQGRMLQIALRAGVPIHRNMPVKDFVLEDGRVAGVVVDQDGSQVTVRAREGVIVNVGGFSRNEAFRKKVTDGPVDANWTSANPGDTGEVIEAMMGLGAATDCLDTAWWVLTSRNLDGSWPEGTTDATGTLRPFMHHTDLSLPHLMMVDRNGKRFADEAGAYMEIGERMFQRNRETSGKAIPAFTILDQQNRKDYPWGPFPPGVTPKSWIESGYMKKADTLEELAAMCGIDAEGLKAEVERFNGFCRTGVDEDYGRGSRAFDLCHGDPSVKPNGSLGTVEKAPFYAVAMYPGDVGTAGGVVADEYARVVRDDGTPIEGLYAVGNSTASVFGRCYPGAGASIGASFTFGMVAAYHALGSDQLESFIS
ncbi:FAD-dependent oxidoreductase [Novosphingobium malaysiense]|uniref:3-ketosteroid-delta-1-dehydrogenase n=1 Tax=Novosphingobium malaysiense TaxID=1348853 RepID=A0A0B1ZF51_9SPHN|nr:FAD-dependent oxidoreductase [Novosphingobium malaysiense]KHK89095.1 3-ketosteroid-delta-1-dehydrogenase [Novosphingobium malaysiense]